MRIAAWQAPLLPAGSMAALEMIAERLRWCEANDVDLLLCPEGILGGLADDIADPAPIAIPTDRIAEAMRPFASPVTAIVGFTETADSKLYNAAAVCRGGDVLGAYRKRHPARRVSVYAAGTESPVFEVGGVRFGLMICNDSNFPELADDMVTRGARLLLVPSNNGLRSEIADVVEMTRAVDIETARRCGVPVVRADVAGRTETRVAFGTSAIVDASGQALRVGARLEEDLLVADLEV